VFHRSSASASVSTVLALAVLAGGCKSSHLPRGADNENLVVGRLKQVNPTDVAVLPVGNSTGKEGLPLEVMRRQFQDVLADLRYSPLALDYVDSRVVEASFAPGALKEDAILQVQVTRWDDSTWGLNSRLTIEADVYLLDAQQPDVVSALWGGHVTRRLDMANERTITATSGELMERTMETFARDVLASLPSRNPAYPAQAR
jgi:hypothetical protein